MPRKHAALALLLAMTGWLPIRSQAATAPVTSTRATRPVSTSSTPGTHDRLFVALFDCSWKQVRKGPTEPTTVAWIHQQLIRGTTPKSIGTGYVSTDCAHDNWLTLDKHGEAFAGTRLAAMYKQLSMRSEAWLRRDPDARISLLIVGGNWGALQGAEFTMMVDVLGLHSPTGEVLVPPHRTAQALALLAPTGYLPSELRLPPSVISGFQLSATDEKRPDFQSLPILGKGRSSDGRFISLPVPGSLSDVCGGYRLNGLSTRAANLLIDYINGLSTTPLLSEQPEPDDPRMNVVHRSEEEGT
ncbi:MAG: hypothetical protein AB1832_09925 [Pseudomonadota bacterium]